MEAPSMVQRAGDKFIVRSVVSGDQLFVDNNNKRKKEDPNAAASTADSDEDTANELVINEDVLAEQDIDEEEEEVMEEEEDEPTGEAGGHQTGQSKEDEWRQQLVKEKLFQLMNQNMDTQSLSWLLFNNNNSVMQNKNVMSGIGGGGSGTGSLAPGASAEDLAKDISDSNLPQCKIKRNYSCSTCPYFTQNPRQYLMHLREAHGEKLIIHECKHCIYASRHYQKLVRHMKMVHGLSVDQDGSHLAVRKRGGPSLQQQQQQLQSQLLLSHFAATAKRAKSSSASSSLGADEINNNSVAAAAGGDSQSGDAKGGPSCSSSRSSRNSLNLINTSRREDPFAAPPPMHRLRRRLGAVVQGHSGGFGEEKGDTEMEEEEEYEEEEDTLTQKTHSDGNNNLIRSVTCKPIESLLSANYNHNLRGDGVGTAQRNEPRPSSLLDLLNRNSSVTCPSANQVSVNNCPVVGEEKERNDDEDEDEDQNEVQTINATDDYTMLMMMLQHQQPKSPSDEEEEVGGDVDNDEDDDEDGDEERVNPKITSPTLLSTTTPIITATTTTTTTTTNTRRTTDPPADIPLLINNNATINNTTDDNTSQRMSKCAVCEFETQSRELMAEHEAKDHIKTKFFRCAKCNYVTHIKARFSKHVKYHSMPMIKCNMCDFRTPYKWNLDRHMKNHGGSGPFKCSACNFTADIKQSLTVHEMNHHDPAVGSANNSNNPQQQRRNRVGASDVQGDTQMTEDDLASGLSFHFLEGSSMLNDHLIAAAAANLKKSARPIPNLIPIQAPAVPPGSSASALNLCSKSTDSNSETSADQDENSNPTSVSSAFKKKHGSFFDKLKEKIGTNGDNSNLTCPCSHVAKCLSELFIHQKSCQKFKQHQMSNKTYSPNLINNKNSSRCQYCRHRCKSSADLVSHMQNCVNAQMFLSSALNVNIEQDSASEMGQSDKMDDEDGEGASHPMENRIFVWNQMPESGGENNDGSVTGSLSGNEGNASGEMFTSTPLIKQEKMDDIDLDLQNPFQSSHPTQLQAQLMRNKTTGESTCTKKVFKCPHCSFWASTASRFHVHIVGHLNKKPFECSLCAYRSNWRWDITKHIRLKTIRDPGHKTAKVLMNDETGRRNYTKYNKYITMMKVSESDGNLKLMKSGEMTPNQEASLQSPHDMSYSVNSSGGSAMTSGPSSLAKANFATMQKLLLNDATSANLLKLSQGAFTAEDLLASGSDLSALILASTQQQHQQGDNSFGEGTPEKKQTSFKCKKCNFKHHNRQVVQDHVKSHYSNAAVSLTKVSAGAGNLGSTNSAGSAPPSVEITPIYNTTNNNIVGGLSAADTSLLLSNPKNLSTFLSSLSAVQAAAAVSGSGASGAAAPIANGIVMSTGGTVDGNGVVGGGGGGGGGEGGVANQMQSLQMQPPALAAAAAAQTQQPSGLMGLNASTQNACVKILPKPVQGSAGVTVTPATKKPVNNSNQANDHGEMDEASSGGTVGHSYRGQLSYRCGHCHQVSNWKHVIQRHCRLKHGGNIKIEQIGKPKTQTTGAAASKQTTDSNNIHSNHTTTTTGNSGAILQQLNAAATTSSSSKQITIPMLSSAQSPPLLAPLLRGAVASANNPEANHSKDLQAVQQRFSSIINSIGSGITPVEETNKKKQYECVHCSYVTDNKSQFSYHKSLHKPIAGEELQCNYCPYTATKRQLLTQHMRIHQSNPDDVIVVESENHSVFPKGAAGSAADKLEPEGKKPSENKENHVSGSKRKKTEFMCPYCPYSDTDGDLVNDHKQFHLAVSNERLKFTCEFCDFNAHSEKTMKDHRKLHFAFLEKGNAVEFCTTYDNLKLFVASTRTTAGPSKDKKIYDEEEIEDENPWMHSATSTSASSMGGGGAGSGTKLNAVAKTTNGLNGKGRSAKMGADSGAAGKAAINV